MRSYEEILNAMSERYKELTGATLYPQSDIYIRMQVLAGEVFSSLVYADWVKKQMFVQSASGTYLDNHASMRGLTRKQATPSQGSVTFYISEAKQNNIVIEKGTVVSTDEVNAHRFETVETVTLLAGKLSVSAKAVSCGVGQAYNVLSDTITVMVTPPNEIEYVKNAEPFDGGADKESDESLRKRVIDSYKFVLNGTNSAYYKSLALSVDGVESAGVIPKARGAGTVDIYISQKNAPATEQQIQQVSKLISQQRELNVDTAVYSAAPRDVVISLNVSVAEGYDKNVILKLCEQRITEYINSKSIGEPVLLCEISDLVFHIDGVENYKFNAVSYDVYPTQAQYTVASTVYVGELDE